MGDGLWPLATHTVPSLTLHTSSSSLGYQQHGCLLARELGLLGLLRLLFILSRAFLPLIDTSGEQVSQRWSFIQTHHMFLDC